MMNNYHDLLSEILDTGTPQFNERTGKVCIMIPGAMLKYDLRAGYPAITTKRFAFDPMKGELCGFMRGATSAADFRALGCNIWNANANENKAWLANPFRKGEDDLGPIYGDQWTNWKAYREPNIMLATCDARDAHNEAQGFTRVMDRDGDTEEYWIKHVNQLENALRTIRNDPSNRRIIISGWNPADFDRMALPPCHVLYQFIVDTYRKQLNMTMYQRSCDMFLGVPFNIASSALLLSIMAQLTGLTPGIFTHFLADVHIYEDHVDQVKLQLSRSHYAPPQLKLDLDVICDDSEIEGAFKRIEPHQIHLLNYNSHEPIKAPMAV